MLCKSGNVISAHMRANWKLCAEKKLWDIISQIVIEIIYPSENGILHECLKSQVGLFQTAHISNVSPVCLGQSHPHGYTPAKLFSPSTSRG